MLEDKKQPTNRDESPVSYGPNGFPEDLFDIELPKAPSSTPAQAGTVPDTHEDGSLIYNEWGFPAGLANLKDDRYRQID